MKRNDVQFVEKSLRREVEDVCAADKKSRIKEEIINSISHFEEQLGVGATKPQGCARTPIKITSFSQRDIGGLFGYKNMDKFRVIFDACCSFSRRATVSSIYL